MLLRKILKETLLIEEFVQPLIMRVIVRINLTTESEELVFLLGIMHFDDADTATRFSDHPLHDLLCIRLIGEVVKDGP